LVQVQETMFGRTAGRALRDMGMNRWAILAILFVARTGLGLQFQTVGSVSGEIAADLGLNFMQIGTLIGVFMLPGLVLSLPTGYMGSPRLRRSSPGGCMT
jgi:hypothetical protein